MKISFYKINYTLYMNLLYIYIELLDNFMYIECLI